MVVTPTIANLIRDNQTSRIDSSIQTGKKLGMQLLDDHLWQLYDEGLISLEEMLDKGRQPGALQDKAMAKLYGGRAKATKAKGKQQEKGEGEDDDMGPVLRT